MPSIFLTFFLIFPQKTDTIDVFRHLLNTGMSKGGCVMLVQTEEREIKFMIDEMWKYAEGEVTIDELLNEMKPKNDEISIDEVDFRLLDE